MGVGCSGVQWEGMVSLFVLFLRLLQRRGIEGHLGADGGGSLPWFFFPVLGRQRELALVSNCPFGWPDHLQIHFFCCFCQQSTLRARTPVDGGSSFSSSPSEDSQEVKSLPGFHNHSVGVGCPCLGPQRCGASSTQVPVPTWDCRDHDHLLGLLNVLAVSPSLRGWGCQRLS